MYKDATKGNFVIYSFLSEYVSERERRCLLCLFSSPTFNVMCTLYYNNFLFILCM
ncbi:hypothetical protein Hanom_Chr03g00266171 [Helianthus anomalus]